MNTPKSMFDLIFSSCPMTSPLPTANPTRQPCIEYDLENEWVVEA